jgi:hypothetical protein
VNASAWCTGPLSEVTLFLEERVVDRVFEVTVLDVAGSGA